jgi:hypothetical protein
VSKLIRRLLGLLFSLGIYSRHHKFTYSGEITSANKIWESKHWSVRSGIKNNYSKIFCTLMLEAKFRTVNEMSLIIFFRSRHDVDNLFALLKIWADSIKGTYIPDDSNKFYKSCHVIYDESLDKNTVEFHLIGK